MKRISIFLGTIIFLLTLTAAAQENRSEVSVQGAGMFTQSSSGNGTTHSATETGGLLATYRYHLNHWISVEGAYGYDLNSQKYLSSGAFRIQSRMNQVTGDLVLRLPSRPSSRLSPYVLAGGGALLFDPTGSLSDTVFGAQSQTKGVFVYGAGFNYAIRKRVSLRVEYRGLVYGTPDFGLSGLQTNSITHTAQPSVGLAFRF